MTSTLYKNREWLAPKERSASTKKDEALHGLQELETVHQKTFGRALELKAGTYHLDNIDGRSTAGPRKSTREIVQ